MNNLNMGETSGPETSNLHQRLLLSGASREQIRSKLIEMAEYYVNKTIERDA